MPKTIEQDLGLDPLRVEQLNAARQLEPKMRAAGVTRLMENPDFHALVSDIFGLADDEGRKERETFMGSVRKAFGRAQRVIQGRPPLGERVRSRVDQVKAFLHKTYTGKRGNRAFLVGCAPDEETKKLHAQQLQEALEDDERNGQSA